MPGIMPERLANESPFKPVAEVVGSGPYRFLKNEHVTGRGRPRCLWHSHMLEVAGRRHYSVS